MKIKYIGFDKDGTLIDSFGGYTIEWGKIIQKDFGIDPKIAEKIFRVDAAGKPTAFQLKLVLKNSNVKLSKEEIFQKANEIALLFGKNVKGSVFPDVLPILKKLKKERYFIFISSEQQEEVVRRDLERTKLLQYVDFYVGIRPKEPDFKRGEPHFRAAAKHFGVSFNIFSKSAVFVGDTPTDIELANELNIISIGRVGTFKSEDLFEEGAKFVIKDISEIYNILQKYNTTVGS